MITKNLFPLLRPIPPWLARMSCSHSEATDNLWSFEQQNPGSVVRFLRGKKMTTAQGLYDEFAAAFQFPYYFGNNGDAFDECLTVDEQHMPPSIVEITDVI